MKFLITSILLLTSTLGAAEEMLSLLQGSQGGKRCRYEYPLSKIEKLPEWDMKGETPLEFQQAVKSAWAHVQKQYPDKKLLLEEVELDPRGYPTGVPANQKRICWVYRFEFVSTNDARDSYKVVMLMDGTIIAPRFEETDG